MYPFGQKVWCTWSYLQSTLSYLTWKSLAVIGLPRLAIPSCPPAKCPQAKPSSLWETFHQDTHTGMAYLYNDVPLTSFCQCTSTGRPTDWLANSGLFTAFSHELSQIVLRHYTRNVINIIVCAITNKWMANNARKLHIWYNFWNRTMKQNGTSKTCRVIVWSVAEILVV